MGLVPATDMLKTAVKESYAVGAFNITSINQMIGVVECADARKSPVIIQTSVTPARFYTPELIVAACGALADRVKVPVCLHLDHCTDVDFCRRCVDAGYTNIMMDGSRYDFRRNIEATREVVDYCREKAPGRVSVEGELGTVSGVEDQVKVAEDEAQLCDPSSAVQFIRESGVDIFAPAIGTAHGVYRTADPKVDFERLARIRNHIRDSGLETPLVVHGTTGLPEHYIPKLIRCGGAKYNVSTDLKHTLIDAQHAYLTRHRDQYNPGELDAAARTAVSERIGFWISLFGSAGRAAR